MKYFVTSDTHFLHQRVMEFDSCQKHRSQYDHNLDSMNAGIIAEWNSVVSPADTVFHLGDIACTNDKNINKLLPDILDMLNGHIILVRGNHDTRTTVRIMKEFYHEVVDYYELRHNKNLICMSHYQFAKWNRKPHGSVQLFGHAHGTTQQLFGRQLDVGWDVWGRLLPLEEAYRTAMSFDIDSRE
ncbi:metallophosphoesterase family protein [Escherichia coli O157]|nr:metallophosphoesterase family protein [Escherichia coli O157]